MNIIVDSTFDPFSYKELMLPVADYRDAYEKVELEYSDLVTQTETWKDIANRDRSPEAFAMYLKYSNDLNKVVDDFSNGMNALNRRALIGLKRRYASEIDPIRKASEAFKEAKEYRDKLGEDALFLEDYNSIDPFLHGKIANNYYLSKKSLLNEVAALALAQAKALTPQVSYTIDEDNPLFVQVTTKRGFNSTDAQQLQDIKHSIMNKIGWDRFSEDKRNIISKIIDEGLQAGLAETSTSLERNAEHIGAAERQANYFRQQLLNLAINDDKRRRGELPYGKDSEGNDLYYNGVSYWKKDKNGEITVISNKGNTDNTDDSPYLILGKDIVYGYNATTGEDGFKRADKNILKGAKLLSLTDIQNNDKYSKQYYNFISNHNVNPEKLRFHEARVKTKNADGSLGEEQTILLIEDAK